MTTTQKTYVMGDYVTFSTPNGEQASGVIVSLNIESVDGTDLAESDMPCHVALVSDGDSAYTWAVPVEWII
jgi:hypothetical protein